MDTQSIELARAGLAVMDELRSPVYDDIRMNLLGRLSVNGGRVEDMREQEAMSRRNLALVTDFMSHLPLVDSVMDWPRIAVDTPDMARNVQANTLWVDIDQNGVYGVASDSPHYIIGARGNTSERQREAGREAVDLLLFNGTRGVENKVSLATLLTSEFEPRYRAVRTNLVRTYEDRELTRMFDPETGKIVVRTGDDMIRARWRGRHHEWSTLKPFRRPEFLRPKTDRMRALISNRRTISDRDLGSFDVLTHLNGLAVAFGKVPVLDELLAEYAGQSRQGEIGSPYEQLPLF